MSYGTAWLNYPGAFALDDGNYDRCPASFQMRVECHRGRVDEVRGCTLESWNFNGREMTRQAAADLVGEDEVRRQEELAATAFWEGAEIAAE